MEIPAVWIRNVSAVETVKLQLLSGGPGFGMQCAGTGLFGGGGSRLGTPADQLDKGGSGVSRRAPLGRP
jgi:hypothetical protein